MRILIVHNRYRGDSPSGEERVVDDEIALLRAAGHEVFVHMPSSDEIEGMSRARRAELAIRPLYSVTDVQQVRNTLRRHSPEVLHLHNPYPLISPWVVRTAQAAGVPVLQTVHNYRMTCVNGSFYRDGHPCTDCSGSSVRWPANRHACYRDSRAQTAVMSLTLTVHRPTWRRVDRYLPVSDFVAANLIKEGIPADRIRVKANSVADPGPSGPPGRTLLFAGRLAAEKGILMLLSAWERSAHPGFDRLVIAGDGPDRAAVDAVAAGRDDVEVLGIVPAARVADELARAGAVAVPSRWFEGFPMTIAEAFARGRPVLTSRIGSLAGIVDESVGWQADVSVEGWRALLDEVRSEDVTVRGAQARQRYLANHTPQVVIDGLLDDYREAQRGFAGRSRT